MRIPVSVLILTRNEEQDLPGCLASVAWTDDAHVFDSCSTDATVAVANNLGARVTQRAFDNYAAQRNAALQTLPYAYPWLLILDADERVPDGLAQEIAQFVANASSEVVAGRIRRRDFLLGTWLKHAQISPFYIRLVRPEHVYYERAVNEVLKVNGTIHEFQSPFDHYPFSKGMAYWVEKHNRYSTMEAQQVMRSRQGREAFVLSKAFFAHDFNERRYHQKELFYRLPGRPLIKWMYMMLARRAFLDGSAGITYATLQSIYEYFIVLKTRELEQQERQAATAAIAK
jgi:glycosyltransferase involved in cell wall biosynthesis